MHNLLLFQQRSPYLSLQIQLEEDGTENPKGFIRAFYDMLQASDEPLWEGCPNWTTLQAATALLNWKSHCNVPVSTFNFILPIFKSMLPKDNHLPDNLYAIKKSLDQLSMPSQKIHACKNHCMLFYDDADKELTHCRWCNEPRYKSDRQKIPQLVLTYMKIGPRLQKLYMNKKTAKDMTWHNDHKTKEGSMAHPSDGKAWKHFDTVNSYFADEIRNVRLGLCTDGFSPNNSNSNPYSLWPVFLTIYNLPPWMSLKDSFVQLSLVIPGRKSPGQNLDVFLRPLIDELVDLYDDGIETYDAYRKQNFTMRAILLWTISDFPAYAMLSGWSTHGMLACPCCMGDTKSFRLGAGGKPCWFDCHRRFLPPKHAFRRDKKGFKANCSVSSSFGPPLELTGEEIYEQVYNIQTVYEGNPYDPKAQNLQASGKHIIG
ncbi:putative transposase-associated domain-containing protein [Tanacetum coccineum]